LPNTLPAADSGVLAESLSTEVSNGLRMLDQRDRDIINSFFGLGTGQALSLEEIGEKYHLTRERVRQIKDKALARLRNNKPLVKELQAYL